MVPKGHQGIQTTRSTLEIKRSAPRRICSLLNSPPPPIGSNLPQRPPSVRTKSKSKAKSKSSSSKKIPPAFKPKSKSSSKAKFFLSNHTTPHRMHRCHSPFTKVLQPPSKFPTPRYTTLPTTHAAPGNTSHPPALTQQVADLLSPDPNELALSMPGLTVSTLPSTIAVSSTSLSTVNQPSQERVHHLSPVTHVQPPPFRLSSTG